MIGVVSSGQNIKGNGLILYYDFAILRSYPGSGTSITDLSGNGYTGTAVNSPSFSSTNGGYFAFDLASPIKRIDVATISTSLMDSTIIAFLRRTGNNYESSPICMSSNATMGIEMDGASAARMYWNGPRAISGTLSLNTWCMLTGTATATGLTIRINNGSKTTSGASLTAKTLATPYIGGLPAKQSLLDIALVMVYNRVLSDDEVGQTFNAFKNRFSL